MFIKTIPLKILMSTIFTISSLNCSLQATTCDTYTPRALSIDGGGIRGIISGMFLAELEKRLGCPLRYFFDEITGTSTGGIIALGIAAGFSAKELFEIYTLNGQKIFESSMFRRGIMRARYDHSGIEAVLEEKFGDLNLSNLSTNVTITSYNLNNGKPYYFSSDIARKDKMHDFSVTCAARSTSAAPTYFAPSECYRQHDIAGSDPQYFIDGGVVINNPAILAYSKLQHAYPNALDYFVLSIGTGEKQKSQKNQAHAAGALSWGTALIDIILSGVSTVNHDLLNLLIPHIDQERNYYRIQAEISEELEPMDNVAPKHIQALKEVGQKLIDENSKEIEQIVTKLKMRAGQAYHSSIDAEAALCRAQ